MNVDDLFKREYIFENKVKVAEKTLAERISKGEEVATSSTSGEWKLYSSEYLEHYTHI